jgi:hypothetical protein
MILEWVVSGAHYWPHYWRLYKRDVPRFMASLRRREDGWYEYSLRDRHSKVPAVYTKLEGLRTLEEAQDAVKVIVMLTESATNR